MAFIEGISNFLKSYRTEFRIGKSRRANIECTEQAQRTLQLLCTNPVDLVLRFERVRQPHRELERVAFGRR